jgi:hypothetical protein
MMTLQSASTVPDPTLIVIWKVSNGSVLEAATNRLHLEPVESASGLRRSCQTVANRCVDSVG